MRCSSLCIVLVCLGLALAVPAPKKLEKKSLPEPLAAKAIEPVEQNLDEPKLNEEALKEDDGEKVDRAKKQASTTFCVEIRQNKPTQVDCDELHRPMPQPPPPPPPQIIIEPQEPPQPPPPPPPPPPPAPAPQIIHQEQPVNFVVPEPEPAVTPCEPEYLAFLYEPTGEVVYYPTGNCAQHVPALLHVPSGSLPFGPTGVFGLPGGNIGPSLSPSMPLFTLPTATVPGTSGVPNANSPSGGTPMTIQITPGTPASSSGPNLVPLNTGSGATLPGGTLSGHTGNLHAHPLIHAHPLSLDGQSLPMSGVNPLHLPSMHGHGLLPHHGHGILPLSGHGLLPLHGQGTPGLVRPLGPSGTPLSGNGLTGVLPGHHYHGVYPNQVQCTCKTAPVTAELAKLAMMKSANADGDIDSSVKGKSADDAAEAAKSGGAPANMLLNALMGRYMMRPVSNVHPMTIQQQSTISGVPTIMSTPGMGMHGMGYPMGYPMYTSNMMPMMRTSGNCPPGVLLDSFQGGIPIQGLRLSREDDSQQNKNESEQKDETVAAEIANSQNVPNINDPQINNPNPTVIDDKANEDNNEGLSARIARLLMPEKDEATNDVENN